MTADRREVEDKYDLDESCVLPDFNTLRGVGSVSTADQELAATYFDTTDLALATAGVTLRRRTGGEDAGWHLKLPMSDGGWRSACLWGAPSGTLRWPSGRWSPGSSGAGAWRPSSRSARNAGPPPARHGGRCARGGRRRPGVGRAGDLGAPGLAPITWRRPRSSSCPATVAARGGVGAPDVGRGPALRQPLEAGPRPGRPARRPASRAAQPTKKGPAADVIQLRLLEQVAVLRRLDPWVRHDAPEAVHDMRVTVAGCGTRMASYRRFLDHDVARAVA